MLRVQLREDRLARAVQQPGSRRHRNRSFSGAKVQVSPQSWLVRLGTTALDEHPPLCVRAHEIVPEGPRPDAAVWVFVHQTESTFGQSGEDTEPARSLDDGEAGGAKAEDRRAPYQNVTGTMR
jgi:hypothetical protein